MIWTALILGFFSTLLLCLGIILMKWILTQVGITVFVMLLFLLTAVFVLAIGDKKHDEE